MATPQTMSEVMPEVLPGVPSETASTPPRVTSGSDREPTSDAGSRAAGDTTRPREGEAGVPSEAGAPTAVDRPGERDRLPAVDRPSEAELVELVRSVELESARQPQRAERRLTRALASLGLLDSAVPGARRPLDQQLGAIDRRLWTGRLLLQRARARHYLRSLTAHEDSGRALHLLRPDEDLATYLTALNIHAISSGYAGDLDSQVRCLTRGIELLGSATEPELRRQSAIMRNNFAVVLYDLGDPRGALDLLDDAWPEADAVGDPRIEEWLCTTAVAAGSYLLLGYEGSAPLATEERQELLSQIDAWTRRAVAAADRAVEAGDPAANRRGAAWCLARRAQLAGELDAALGHARRAIDLTTALGEIDVLARARVLLGELLLASGQPAEAEPVLRRVVSSADRFGSTTLVVAWHHLADLYERRGNLHGAVDAMKHYVACVTGARSRHTRYDAASAAARLRRERIERERDRWRAESEQERRAARVDPLTGIGNRRAFNDTVAELARDGEQCALALFDIDHFKAVNDTYGHLVGDDVLRRCAAAMAEVAREHLGGEGQQFFRMGGEEFAVLFRLTGRTVTEVRSVVDDMREAAADAGRGDQLPAITVTQSAGVAVGEAGEGASPGTALLTRADDKLYAAKRSGRNRTEGP